MRIISLFALLICGLAQSQNVDIRLARNYMEQGEYEKARSIYTDLYTQQRNNVNYLYTLIEVNSEMEDYASIDSLISAATKRNARLKQLLVDRGAMRAVQGDTITARKYYNEALDHIIQQPNMAYAIGARFQHYSLLQEALKSYQMGMELNERANYNAQIAQVYGELGRLDDMFGAYLDMIDANPNFRGRAQSIFSRYLRDDSEGVANQALRKALLRRSQENPQDLYNSLLSWLFVQQGDYKKAFLQEKAIYLRNLESLRGIQNLANITIKEKDNSAARMILRYLRDNAPDERSVRNAEEYLLKLDAGEISTPDEVTAVQEGYDAYFAKYGTDKRSLYAQLDYAEFLAYKKNDVLTASQVLRDQMKLKLGPFQKAQVQIALGDLLVLQDQYSKALILYTQVMNALPNDKIAQTAQYKVAQTSYYKGDFDWALTQLGVLEASSSKLIANDALELALVIKDNSTDTARVALKKFARGNLASFKKQPQQAMAIYEDILTQHKGEEIEDEALLYLAREQEKAGDTDAALANYNKLIELYQDSILVDDAYYAAAQIYEREKGDLENARAYYERLIFDHADSIFFVDARERFRILRGDTTRTPS